MAEPPPAARGNPNRGSYSMRRQPPSAAAALMQRLTAAGNEPDAPPGALATELQRLAAAPSASHRQPARGAGAAHGGEAPAFALLAARPGAGTGLSIGPIGADATASEQGGSPMKGRCGADASAAAPGTPDRSGEGGRRRFGGPTPGESRGSGDGSEAPVPASGATADAQSSRPALRPRTVAVDDRRLAQLALLALQVQ